MALYSFINSKFVAIDTFNSLFFISDGSQWWQITDKEIQWSNDKTSSINALKQTKYCTWLKQNIVLESKWSQTCAADINKCKCQAEVFNYVYIYKLKMSQRSLPDVTQIFHSEKWKSRD